MFGLNYDTYKNLIKELGDQKYALDQSAIVAITDEQGKIKYINNKFCEISGYTRDELIGQDHRIINSGTHGKLFFKDLWSTIKNGKTWHGEICNRRKDNTLYWVHTTIVPFVTDGGSPYQFMAIRHEITELKELQRKIMDQQVQMISASKLSAIGEMASTVTHEINNPLGVILGRCEMLKEEVSKRSINVDSILKNIEAIEKTGQRIERIVKSMKALAYHGSDEPFCMANISEIINDTLELCIERFKNYNINIYVENVDSNASIYCRSHQIVQILVNLLNNAHDALIDQENKWVKIKVLSKDDSIEISVIDSGSGIKEDVLLKIFQPFFSTKRARYGTGLGLSISKNIMREHDGDLVYDSSRGNTCFKLIFPTSKKVTK